MVTLVLRNVTCTSLDPYRLNAKFINVSSIYLHQAGGRHLHFCHTHYTMTSSIRNSVLYFEDKSLLIILLYLQTLVNFSREAFILRLNW